MQIRTLHTVPVPPPRAYDIIVDPQTMNLFTGFGPIPGIARVERWPLTAAFVGLWFAPAVRRSSRTIAAALRRASER